MLVTIYPIKTVSLETIISINGECRGRTYWTHKKAEMTEW